jgi:hypothetical protein
MGFDWDIFDTRPGGPDVAIGASSLYRCSDWLRSSQESAGDRERVVISLGIPAGERSRL